MANYQPFARSNYFRVRDVDKFKERFNGLNDMRVSQSAEGLVSLICEGESAWPSDGSDPVTGEEQEDYDFIKDLQAHLADGQVCVLIEIGYEKMRYLVGNAVAFVNFGSEYNVNLNDIYDVAEKMFGIKPTLAEH